MLREIDYVISPDSIGMQVGYFLKQQGYSEKLITSLRNDPKGLSIHGKLVFTIYKFQAGDVLHVRMEEREGSKRVLAIRPKDMPQIIYEDEDILVVNKPAHMPVHPSMEHYEDTLANAICWHLQENLRTRYPNKEISDAVTYRIINRLDKDTSGLTLIAKNRLSAGILSEAMVRREIHRTYRALCAGQTPDEAVICAPIARVEGSVLERCINYETGETAITHYKTLQYIEETDASLVELWLETGRTHQIRVHMKHIGHPLLGDFLYNPTDTRMPHQALHSYRLEFIHPITKEAMCFLCETEWAIILG